MLIIPYPVIDPVALALGPFEIRWYALAYIVGLILGWRYCLWLAKRPPAVASPAAIDDFLVWATLGVVLGGRTGYVLFYQPQFYMAHPSQILEVWHGGMSFHGGLLGVMVALYLFCRQRGLAMLAFADIIAPAVPIGLFFGRIANFINDELWGRPTDVPWAMIFPTGGPVPRHPSQLYEAGLEGLVLFVILFVMVRFTNARNRPGLMTGVFLMGYALARIFCEFFREPDPFLGFLWFGATMGQLLSIPVFLIGLVTVWYARWKQKA